MVGMMRRVRSDALRGMSVVVFGRGDPTDRAQWSPTADDTLVRHLVNRGGPDRTVLWADVDRDDLLGTHYLVVRALTVDAAGEYRYHTSETESAFGRRAAEELFMDDRMVGYGVPIPHDAVLALRGAA